MGEAYIENIRCDNCGYNFREASGRAFELANSTVANHNCPVCSFSGAATLAETGQNQFSAANLESQLKTLLHKARTQGVTSTEIVAVLRSELEFEAELAQTGRRILVQIIDLGFQEAAQVITVPYYSGRELLQKQDGH